jgi:hypothetical protein
MLPDWVWVRGCCDCDSLDMREAKLRVQDFDGWQPRWLCPKCLSTNYREVEYFTKAPALSTADAAP